MSESCSYFYEIFNRFAQRVRQLKNLSASILESKIGIFIPNPFMHINGSLPAYLKI